MDKKALRRKIERELRKSKNNSFNHEGKTYFYHNGDIYFLESSEYFRRLRFLQKSFSNRITEPNYKELISQNLVIGASLFPMKDYLIPKITVFRDSCWNITFKIENYSEDDPIFGDNKDIMFKRSLTDARGNVLDDIEQSWNTARERENPLIMEYARKVLRWLRGD